MKVFYTITDGLFWAGLFLVYIVLGGCGRSHTPSPTVPSSDESTIFSSAQDRLVSGFMENGQVVSRHGDGSPDHLGEALLWSGIAAGVMACDKSAPIAEAIYRQIETQNGALVRYLPLGGYAGGKETNFDEETGFYYFAAARGKHCPGEAGRLKSVWQKRLDYVSGLGGRLHANVSETMPKEFTFTRDAISFALGAGAKPDGARLLVLEQEIAASAEATTVAKAPCYRVHLELRHYLALEALGLSISKTGKGEFCAATKAMDIPLVDWWCGRAVDYGAGYKFNEWEYRHQRCGAWETPDGQGDTTPGLDLVDYLSNAYSLPH